MKKIKWPAITNDTSMSELKRIHQMIWNYAIKYGEKPRTPYLNNCAACEYDECHRGECCDCPIAWPKNENGIHVCAGAMGLYDRWHYAEGEEEKTDLAKQIRDLPWKFE